MPFPPPPQKSRTCIWGSLGPGCSAAPQAAFPGCGVGGARAAMRAAGCWEQRAAQRGYQRPGLLREPRARLTARARCPRGRRRWRPAASQPGLRVGCCDRP